VRTGGNAKIPSQGRPQTKISFVTDWKAQAEHGGFYQALAEGLTPSVGLDVRSCKADAAVNVPQLLAGGAADFGMGSNISFRSISCAKARSSKP
jgi:NitT/TauT family transport system substrate-binding protein